MGGALCQWLLGEEELADKCATNFSLVSSISSSGFYKHSAKSKIESNKGRACR